MSPVVKRPQPHTRNFSARRFVDAAQTVGEECIALSMLHSSDPNNDAKPKSDHWDEIYQQIDEFSLENEDYGNPFEGGIREVFRTWSIWTETTDPEQYERRGEYLQERRSVQVEPYPELRQHDYLIRVSRWNSAGKPMELYPVRYVITSAVTDATVHTGAQLSQTNKDRWGQKFNVSGLPDNHPIYAYEVDMTQPFPRKTYPPFSS